MNKSNEVWFFLFNIFHKFIDFTSLSSGYIRRGYITIIYCIFFRIIDEAGDGTVGVDMASQSSYDLVILDIMMPDIDGWEVCYRIQEFQNVPILMLTARTDITDRVRGLNLGADDYLTKPFAPEELVARVNALLRRHEIGQSSSTPYFIQDGLSIDSVSREVKVNEQLVEFTRKEFELFHLLVSQPNQVYTREILLNQIGSLYRSRYLQYLLLGIYG
ncbi:response regulator transcription factor [Pseudalkalibacillus hwajinpoensis]|uniref:response regulator transcription factor n=1 Tax=Guptibacillus hwajinpoensis TaxID=208199 RepID=UPI002AC31B93|nr:response regulator transcription factor [Pseudalkalibacillus hwajinpoensis]